MSSIQENQQSVMAQPVPTVSTTVQPVQPVPPVQTETKTEQPKKRKTKRKPYKVAVPSGDSGHSLINVTKSSPRAAVSAAVRGVVKSIPLRTPVTVWTKSSSRVHAFTVTRDYDTKKHRRFTVARAVAGIGTKQVKPEHNVPADLL